MYPESIEVNFYDDGDSYWAFREDQNNSEDLKFELWKQGLLNRISDHKIVDWGKHSSD
jgi:hypothetical protein